MRYFNGAQMVLLLYDLHSLFFLLQEVERDVKMRTKGEMGAAKSLCSPFEQPELPEGTILFS